MSKNRIVTCPGCDRPFAEGRSLSQHLTRTPACKSFIRSLPIVTQPNAYGIMLDHMHLFLEHSLIPLFSSPHPFVMMTNPLSSQPRTMMSQISPLTLIPISKMWYLFLQHSPPPPSTRLSCSSFCTILERPITPLNHLWNGDDIVPRTIITSIHIPNDTKVKSAI